MDVEFHYYMTYLIAARAGFPPVQAEIVAHAAQSIDDNHIKYVISSGDAGPYANYISQTLDILKPSGQLYRIYPIFHFIPGEPDALTAKRIDGREDAWVTTPDGPIARKMMDAALASGSLHRIGAAAHGYADTWAHQNFLGRRDSFNDMPGAGLSNLLLNVGHGAAEHQPDKPALIWTDARLANGQVSNRIRFLDAAEAIFKMFAIHIDPTKDESWLASNANSLRADLDADIGPNDSTNSDLLQQQRIGRYRDRAKTQPYGGTAIGQYDEFAWFNEAVLEDGAELRQRIDHFLDIADDYLDQTTAVPCSWDPARDYRTTNWFLFVEAVKSHQNECWAILEAAHMPALDAKGL